jgi:hypothetical protein
VHTTLNFTAGPPHPRLRREQFCGLRVPGLPPIPGGAGDPSLVCAWFIDRYRQSDQDRIIAGMRATGATHWTLSWPDSRAVGQSIGDYVATASWLVAQGFWVCHKLFSKVYDQRNPDPATVYPVMDALVSAGAVTCAAPAWEMNAFVDPEAMDGICDPLAERYPTVLWYLHFLSGYAAWQKNTNDSPGAFWNRRLAAGYTGLEYQCVPVTGIDSTVDAAAVAAIAISGAEDTSAASSSWSAGMMQARLNDCLVRLCPGGLWATPGIDLIAWETTAQPQFNGQQDEVHGDLRGYESMCARGPMALSGYGNGARRPDGSAL